MKYRLSVEFFDKSFAVKEDGKELKHNNGNRFKLFPSGFVNKDREKSKLFL